MLTNNNSPMPLIDGELSKFVINVVEGTAATNLSEPIKIFYRSQMLENYKQEELTLKKIVNR